MTAAVKPHSDGSASAFAVSLLLHGAMLLLPLAGMYRHAASRSVTPEPPNSVAMLGNSIEVEAPTPELAAAPTPPPAAEPEPQAPAVDVRALPAEPVADAEPIPKPKPARARPPKKEQPQPKRSPAPAAASQAASSDPATDGARAAGTFGQEGLAPGVRRLGYAFTRAIPAATPADEEWRELPAGKVGTIRIQLSVDENNRLGAVEPWQARTGEPAPPAILQRMVERTLLLLRAGQFALSGSNQAGTERLIIEVQVSDEAAEGEGESVVVLRKFDGASPGRPGTAYFRYGTGRAVEAKVTIVPAARR